MSISIYKYNVRPDDTRGVIINMKLSEQAIDDFVSF